MKSSWAHKIVLYVAILYTLLLTWGSLMSAPVNTEAPEHLDKVMHFAAYFGLTLLWLIYKWKLKITSQALSLKVIILIMILTVLYGIVIEVLQGRYTADRIADGWDVTANSIGALLGAVIFITVINKSERLKSIF